MIRRLLGWLFRSGERLEPLGEGWCGMCALRCRACRTTAEDFDRAHGGGW